MPVLSPPSGTYTSPQMVSITSATPGATIYYTTDGTVPGRSSPVFNPMNPIPVSSTEIIKAYAVAPGYGLSPEGWAQYTIIPPYAPTPTFSLAAGFYDSSVQVAIMDSLAGAKIYYTTDHTTPTTSSPLYNGTPITISSTEQLQAIAVATNYSPSAVAIGDYYVAAAKPSLQQALGHLHRPADGLDHRYHPRSADLLHDRRNDPRPLFAHPQPGRFDHSQLVGDDQSAGRGHRLHHQPGGRSDLRDCALEAMHTQ